MSEPRTAAVHNQPIPSFGRSTVWQCAIALSFFLLIEAAVAAYFQAPASDPALLSWRMDYSRAEGSVSEEALSPTARQYLRFDAGESKAVDLPGGDLIRVIDLKWQGGEISAVGARAHSPLICLPALGYELQEELAPTSFRIGSLECVFKRAAFQRKGRTAFVYYGLWEAGVPVSATPDGDQSLKGALASLATRRRLGETRSLLFLIAGPPEIDSAEFAVQAFLRKVVVLENSR